MTLKEYLTDWCDIDCAAMQLSQCLGLMDDKTDFIGKAKHVFWSNHPMGEALYTLIFNLVDIGVVVVVFLPS